jgi:BRCT domain type II-containing protein
MAEKTTQKPADDEKATTSSSSSSSTEKATTSAASEVRKVAQDQPDRVAIVSRTSTGEPHQSPDFEVIGLPDDATEAQTAAAENRPEKG